MLEVYNDAAAAAISFFSDIMFSCYNCYISAERLMGDKSLLTVQEPRHRYLRNLVMPAFTNEAIEKLTERMERVIGSYLDKWAGSAQPVVATEEMQRMTFDFIIAVRGCHRSLLSAMSHVI